VILSDLLMLEAIMRRGSWLKRRLFPSPPNRSDLILKLWGQAEVNQTRLFLSYG